MVPDGGGIRRTGLGGWVILLHNKTWEGIFFNSNYGGSFFATAKHGGRGITRTSDLVVKMMVLFAFGPSVFYSGKHGG